MGLHHSTRLVTDSLLTDVSSIATVGVDDKTIQRSGGMGMSENVLVQYTHNLLDGGVRGYIPLHCSQQAGMQPEGYIPSFTASYHVAIAGYELIPGFGNGECCHGIAQTAREGLTPVSYWTVCPMVSIFRIA